MLGWMATAVFASSYFCNDSATLKKIQAAAASLWIVYGIAIGAVPVVVANLIVAGAALYSSLRPLTTRADEPRTQIQNPALPAVAASMAEDFRPENG
jgi:hypothetical protein